MTAYFQALSLNRQSCTGVPLPEAISPRFISVTTSEDEFVRLISEYYKFFREAVAADVAFLRSIERHRDILEFDKVVNLLRTAKQHDDSPEAKAFYGQWVATSANWQQAADRLSECLNRALSQLVRISGRARRDPALAAAWRDRISVTPESIFESVCRDLGVSFGDARKAALIRNVKRRVKSLPASTNVKTAVERFCLEEAISQPQRLPVPYYRALDRLNLLGKPQARAAMMLAFSISTSTALRGEDFLLRLEEAWLVATR